MSIWLWILIVYVVIANGGGVFIAIARHAPWWQVFLAALFTFLVVPVWLGYEFICWAFRQ